MEKASEYVVILETEAAVTEIALVLVMVAAVLEVTVVRATVATTLSRREWRDGRTRGRATTTTVVPV